MNDKEFLQWLYDRLHYVHGEDVNKDYMWKLRAIIRDTKDEARTPVIDYN